MKTFAKIFIATALVLCGINVANAGWQCNATNARGQLWVGTGPTRAVAAANASGFCTAHSSRAANCRIKGCFVKY